MSDTPRTDKVLYSVDVCDGEDVVNIAFAREFERELNAANSEIERLTSKVSQLYEGAEEQKQRIQRLEEAGNELMYDNDDIANINRWNKAKEAKP
jgi:hypothetical protein